MIHGAMIKYFIFWALVVAFISSTAVMIIELGKLGDRQERQEGWGPGFIPR
jgi:hypothetical protein